MHKRIIFCLFLLVIQSKIHPLTDEEREKLRAELIVKQTLSNIYSLEQQILLLKEGAFGVPDLLREIEKLQKELGEEKENLKEKKGLDIQAAETQQMEILTQMNEAATQIYAKAKPTGEKNLYADVNRLLSEVYDNDMVKDRMKKIIGYTREISQIIEKQLEKIKILGDKINGMTPEEQKGTQGLKNQLLEAKAQLGQLLLSLPKDEDKEPKEIPRYEKIETKIFSLQDAIQGKLSDLPQSSQDTIRRIQNSINRLTLMLEYLRDPDKIKVTTPEEVVGLQPIGTQ